MNIQEILNNKLINKSELARLMWPDTKDFKSRINNKIHGKAGQRLTAKDRAKIGVIIIEFFEKVYSEPKNEDVI
jgi:hypothetical protein